MPPPNQSTLKTKLHPRNKNRERYDLKVLVESCGELAPFVKLNNYGDKSIDFFNPKAVKILNKALLQHFYHIKNWDIPPNYLCPPIPGRADYIHHIADLLAVSNKNIIPKGEKIKCLDIGVGANCVYPIIGNVEYGWSFIGSDIDKIALQYASKIIASNPFLQNKIEFRLQNNPKAIFQNIILPNEFLDLTICNPPFHASLAEAQAGTQRKISNLKGKKITKPILNFGGQNNELWCEGGESLFVRNMILESKQFSKQCFWFSTLISKQSNLENAYKTLKSAEPFELKTISMGQGNKISRILAWTFLNSSQQKTWVGKR